MFGRASFRFRPLTWFLAAIFSLLVGVFAIGCFWFSSPPYHGPRSAHFDGKRFFNIVPTKHAGFFNFLKWIWTREPGLWLPLKETPYAPPPPEKVPGYNLRVTFINHSTVLIQTAGLNILTDPVWSMRIGPVPKIGGPKRHIMPGIRFEDLPPIDVVLISHDHYDHLDIPTLKMLEERFSPVFFTGLGDRKLLKDAGMDKVHEMDWWDSSALSGDVTINFVPSQHFSARSYCDRDRTLWGGFVIETPGGPVYFASDTGMGPHFDMIKERFGTPRVAFLPIAAFLPRWFMGRAHLSPEDAVEVHGQLKASVSIPIHYGTFRLGDDGQFEAPERLANQLISRSIKNFLILKPGEGRDIP